MRIFASLQEQTKASFWRSDVLRPLHILFLALSTITIALTYTKAPDPLIYGAGVLLGLVALTEIGGFIYCLLKDPDLLRSERIRMHKMAIEARMLGDETTGLMEIEQQAVSSQLAPQQKAIATQDVAPTLEPLTKSMVPAPTARSRVRKGE